MADVLTLIKPTAALRASYIAFVQDFLNSGEKLVPFVLRFPYDDFDALLAQLTGFESGIGTAGFPPNSTFWLVRNDVDIVAVSNLRHYLTPGIEQRGGHIGYGVRPAERKRGYATSVLAKTLDEAKKFGINRALLTCAKDNRGSAKTIVSNGGVLENECVAEEDGIKEIIQRYWIELGKV